MIAGAGSEALNAAESQGDFDECDGPRAGFDREDADSGAAKQQRDDEAERSLVLLNNAQNVDDAGEESEEHQGVQRWAFAGASMANGGDSDGQDLTICLQSGSIRPPGEVEVWLLSGR